jgi:NhaP-type Na+/H+ or K+/H+ antiporter
MSESNLLLFLLTIALFSLFSGPISRGSLTPPLVFTVIGLFFSSIGFGWIKLEVDNGLIHSVAEITLILVLFTDAARINLKVLWQDHDIPVRLLLLGMPMTIGLGTLVAMWLFPELLIIEALVLAVILAPTDAALGQVVVSSTDVPERIRQSLNIESGLNDGVALPALLFVISFAMAIHSAEQNTDWLTFIILQLTLGPLMGALVGWSGAHAINYAIRHKFLTYEFCNIYLLCLAFISYLAADVVGGNGFIAAFIAGIAVGNTLQHANEGLYEFAESQGQLLNLIVFFLFGVSLLPAAWHQINGEMITYALLSLTIIRILPVFLSLLGKHLHWHTKLFIGWFGPRGLASILFILLVLEHANLAHEAVLLNTVVLTVALSILLHGISAMPGVKAYAAILKMCLLRGDDLSSEHQSVIAMPLRLSEPNVKEKRVADE